MADIEELNLERLEVVQNRLVSSLFRQAKDLQLAASDWLQGGWSRGKREAFIDTVDVGFTKSAKKE